MTFYDIAVIGAGVIGSGIARELSRYQTNICVIEKNADVCEGTSKANSAIIHAGFDAKPGTLKAKLNAQGNSMIDKIAQELDVPFKRIGALVLCFSETDMPALEALLEKGIQNGIPDLKILTREELLEKEPNLADGVYAGLYAPTSGIVCPFEFTLGFAENACANGAVFHFETEVQDIERTENGYKIMTSNDVIECKAIVNAAGVYADDIHNMACEKDFSIVPRAGEYLLLDKSAGTHASHTIFQLPNKFGKGILVTPTVHGNLLIGPTATDVDDKEAVRTTAAGLRDVSEKSALSIKNIPMNQVITSFTGLRAHADKGDFILAESAPLFFDAAGIESPGLSASPAVAEKVACMVKERLKLQEKTDFNAIRKRVPHLSMLSFEERAEKVKENPDFGAIICRCEEVSEGEILAAIHRPLGAKTLDGVKRRTRAGMGRCQAGFCSHRVMEILARELETDMTKIRKDQKGSEIVFEKTRGEGGVGL